MDETEQSKPLTPLGNERRDNPGQTNVMMNSDGADLTPAAPQWDNDTPLEDIAKQYSGIGGKFNDLVENAADNVGDRQVQLIGNDFGATNPYMFNTYYEPIATSFASKMRVEGTNEALNEGLDRAEKEAQDKLAAAKQRYSNAVAAQKAREEAEQARRNASAYVSETDTSKLPQSTSERDFINSEEFARMSDEERSQRLTEIRTKDMQDTLAAAGDNINWDIKGERSVATDSTLSKFGMTRDQLNAMSDEERKAFWARKDVGNYWTEQYMVNYFRNHYSEDRAGDMQTTFNDIHNDVNAIIDAINNNTVEDLSASTFVSAIPVTKDLYQYDDIVKSINDSDLTDEEKSELINRFDTAMLGEHENLERLMNDFRSGKVSLDREKQQIIFNDDEEKKYWNGQAKRRSTFSVVNPLADVNQYDRFAEVEDLMRHFKGNIENADNMSLASDLYDRIQYLGGSTQWANPLPTSLAEQNAQLEYLRNDTFSAAFGVDWQSIAAIAELKKNSPDDYEYLLNQTAFVLSNNPVEIVEDENKEYFINGEYKKLSKGDLVFHTIDGTVDKDGKFKDQDLQRYVDLYKKIYNGQEEASDENLDMLQKYYSGYASRLQAAMAATGRFGVQVDEDIYGAILSVMTDDSDGEKLIFNPNDPTGDKISVNEFKTWWNNLTEDEQYNFYYTVADRARQTTGHYYIYDDRLKGVKDVLGGKSNGENIIGKRGKSEGDSDMWAADKVKNFSDEQCLAINMVLDFQMRNGGIEQKFFDNEEVSVPTRFVNKFFEYAVGSAEFVAWAGLSALGWVGDIFVDDKNNALYKAAGAVWDDMSQLTPEDNISFLDDKDLVLGNNWTMEVRTQQRANLNHLIDTTFNIDYFDPDNTYDEATGEIKDKDGNVIAYTDNHYFHNDNWKAGVDFATDILAGIGEFAAEIAVTAGLGKLAKTAVAKLISKSPAAARFARTLTARATISGLGAAKRANRDAKAIAKAQSAAQKAGKELVVKQAKYGKAILKVVDADDVAKAAGKTASAAAGGESIADDVVRAGGREAAANAATKADDVGRAIKNGASYVDDVAREGTSVVDDIVRDNPIRDLGSNVVDDVYEGEIKMSAAGVEWSSSSAQEQAARNYAMDALIESSEASTVSSANKLASYIEKALVKTGDFFDKISPFKGVAQDLRAALKESSLNMLQRAAMNTRVAEAAGVSVEQVSKLSDNSISVLYNALRSSEGKGVLNAGAYTNRYIGKAGEAIKASGLDFSAAVKEAVSQSTALASAGRGLTAEDTIRILARNSTDSNALLSALKTNNFVKNRLVDWAQDIKMNYYSPYLDNEFNSDYTDVAEYFSDPKQWLSGAAFDLGVSGLRRGINSISLTRTNHKINALLGKIDTSPSSAVDKAKLNKNLVKLNNARIKADKLSNKILDGGISVNKVTDVREKATNTLNEYMTRITDGFDYEKGIQQMASNMEDAMADYSNWDKVKDFFTTKNGTALLGRSRAMQAMDLNRFLLKSNDSLNAFYMLAQAEQSNAIINYAEAKAHSNNLRKLTGEQWSQIVADGFLATSKRKTGELFDLKGNTINIADKAKAKELLAEGQTVLYDAIYDSAYEKLHAQAGNAIDWPAFRSELNWVRDQMIEMGSKQIDMGNSVRWNYFPTQGIMFDMDPDTPIALAGFYYGSGLHPDVSNQMANPFDTRDTWDMASISSDIRSGKKTYIQPIGEKERIRNAAHGIELNGKEIQYNMEFFNPVNALTAYRNAFNSKQFAAKMFDPMQNGHVVVRSDSALQFATEGSNAQIRNAADNLEAKLKKEYTDAHRPKTYRNGKKLANDIDALRSKTQKGITDVQKNIRTVSSRDINAQTRKLNKQIAAGEQAVAKSDLFKGYRDYAGLKGKSNKTVASSMMKNYDQVVADVKAVRKALKAGQETAEGVSEAYKASTLYKQNVDALARDKNLTKDVISNTQSIRIGGENGVDLNANALKTPFYNTIASLEQTNRINRSWENFKKALSEDEALVTGTKYSLSDFVKVHFFDETDLRKTMSASIYDIVNERYGVANEITGGKTLNKTFSKTLNQAIYDAFDEVSLRKAAGEGISMVEVLEELNNKFPDMEIAGDERYWNLLADLSKYSNGGGDTTTLKASISAELQYRADKGELDGEDAQKLIKMLGVIDEASDESSRLSGLANNSAAIRDIDEAVEAGDERMLIDEDADPKKQAIMREEAAENAPTENVSDNISKAYDVSALNDKERLEALTDGLEVLRKNASGRSDIATRSDFNSTAFNTFREDVKKPYQSIASELETKLKKKGVNITNDIKTILHPPEKGIFEGVSDAQMLRAKRASDEGLPVELGKKTYAPDGTSVTQGLEIGQDGRGIVNYYKPKALQKLADKYDIKLTKKNAAALNKLTDGSTEFSLGGNSFAVGYAEFAEAMTGNEYRYILECNVVNLRAAVENDISAHKTNATKLLRTSEEGLGIYDSDFRKASNMGQSAKLTGFDGRKIEVNIVNDYGTAGASDAAAFIGDEVSNNNIGYHFEVTASDGTPRYISSVDDLYNLLDSDTYKTVDDIVEDFNKQGVELPKFDGEGRATDYFRKEYEPTSSGRTPMWEIDKNRAKVLSQQIKKDRARIDELESNPAKKPTEKQLKTYKQVEEWKKLGFPNINKADLDDWNYVKDYNANKSPEAIKSQKAKLQTAQNELDQIQKKLNTEGAYSAGSKYETNSAQKTAGSSLDESKTRTGTSAVDKRTQRELDEWNRAQQERFNQYDNVVTERTKPEDFLLAKDRPQTNVETFAGNWTAKDVKDATDKVFLFGDNIEDAKTGYKPKSTQAVIRGEENAIGIPTKKNRGTSAASYFTDADFDEFKTGVDNAIAKAKESGKTIVLPENGIGTGAAQLEKRAPKCFKYLQEQLDSLSAQASSADIRNPDNWSLESIMFTNQATDAARSEYVNDYNRYQRLKEASKEYADSTSALDFAGETSNYSMTISEQKLNNFLYGDENGKTGHFDKISETTERINKLNANTEKIFNEKISDRISALKKLDGTSYDDIVETLEAAKAEAIEAYKENPAVQKQIAKRFDEEISFVKQKLGKTKLDAQKFADHDPELKALREAQKSQASTTVGEGQVMVHNVGSMLVVGNDTTVQNRISLKDLRAANEVVDIKTGKTYNPIESVSRAKADKNVLKDMRKSFNNGFEVKGKISSNTARQKNAWIDDLVAEVRERTGNPDIDEADILIDKQLANLGQFYFREGRQGWQEKAYRVMSSISELNKQIQDFHLAGGVGQFNAFTLRNAITMMWQDPVGGTRALFSNFKNAKDNTSVMKYFIDNHENLLKYAMDSGDFSIINAFAPIISMDERLVGGGVVDGVIHQVYGAKNTFKEALEREGKRSAILSVPKGIYEEIFSNPTFARWTVIAKADMQMRNYAKAERFVNRMASRFNLSDEDFATADGGMWGSKDQFIATLARLRTDRYWNPADFALTGFSSKKYLARKKKGDIKTTAESLKGIQSEKSLAECASDFFFAINYKLQMNAHPINGIGSMVASVFTVPRANMMARRGNLAPIAMRFAGRGDRNQAAVMLGIAALAHAWNTYIGAPSAWEELWGDHGNRDNGTYGIAQSLLNFQDFGKFWIPNDGNGGFDPNKTAASIDPFFSIFTLQNTGFRALNKALYPNQVPINWQRSVGAGPISVWNGEAPIMNEEPTSFGTRIAGVADELIGANLLAGYKALYEVCMNSTYFGNNIWERKYLPDGTINKNYDPLRNVIASMAHILNMDAVLEGKGMTENGSNRWVKGLTVESGKGLIIGEPGKRQDKVGTVSGSGIFQHEYASALGAAARGDYFDGLTEAMELPFKTRNYASKAKTALNQEVMLAMRNELHKYKKAVDGASPEDKEKAYAEFANAAVNIMHDWSAKYGNVLGKNDELTSTATKVMISFLSDEYDDRTAYVQNFYEHLRQELKMADGDEFLYSKERLEDAIAAGMDPEEAAATYNKHLTALKEAQIAEYNARKALLDAGININPDENIFDTNDILYADFEAEKATVNKKLLTEIRGKLDSKVGEFSNYKEMKAYYESLIDDAATTKQKAKIAKEYNKFVEDIISPYLEEYGENVLNSSYWDGDYLSNHLGKYLIIPADTQYRGKTPYSNFLKDEFGVGFRDNKNLPSDDEIREAILKANKALAQGRMASTKAIVDNALVQSRRGTVHASKEDYEKLLRLRAMLSSRSN